MATMQQQYSSSGFGGGRDHSAVPQTSSGQQQQRNSGLNALAEGSQYVQRLQQQQHQDQQSPSRSASHARHKHSYSDEAENGLEQQQQQQQDSASGNENATPRSGSKTGAPVRRRITRACDQCNQLRTKCDGKRPCAHCVEFSLTCEYVRERKKRGKASRKNVTVQQQANAVDARLCGVDRKEANGRSESDGSPAAADDNAQETVKRSIKRRRSSANCPPPQLPPPRTGSYAHQHSYGEMGKGSMSNGIAGEGIQGTSAHDYRASSFGLPAPRLPSVSAQDRGLPVSIGDFGSIDNYHRSMLHPGGAMNGNNILHNGNGAASNPLLHGGTITGYGESPYAIPSPGSQGFGFLGQSPLAGSPSWLSLPSPSAALYPGLATTTTNSSTLRYPVLRPILPHITAIIPIGLACDLLELYFSSTSSTFWQSQSPYVIGYLFRRRSFLREHHPRPCSPALLASMLWVAAQTSESAFLTSPPSARGRICRKLLELTVGLLKPLIHAPNDGPSGFGENTVVNGVALGGFGMALPSQTHEMEGGTPGATGALDDVATYINLAIVVSASEYKAASLRWWNAAWTMARELKLGKELPPNPEQDPAVEAQRNGQHFGPPPSAAPANSSPPGFVSEEEREERRRIWWLLYIVDRHLALCYNRPLFLLDAECDGLRQPEDDNVWQTGEYYPNSEDFAESLFLRRRGQSYQCTGHSIFGYFLPLMTMLGEIVDLNHARNHPAFGTAFQNSSELENQAAEITRQLEAFSASLKDFEARNIPHHHAADSEPHLDVANTPSVHSVVTSNSSTTHRMTEAELQTKMVIAYGTHLMHTMHILLNGKWDPISLLDDNDLWISSQSFISATGHAVSAAEAINEILEHDPDLSFMPFFFGIYLLQGSFLLLLIADKLQGEASPSVAKACETIVRAHEACVVTLNTEYQRNFRKVMRSALAQVKGRGLEDFGEQQQRRREVLALYRWTGDGTGLAL
ncbi:hypothetical protein K431DRAFT_314190 [Polychaeton citri CBS 116435]|uniref:Zn(2)-C6 fungal-type domain-containing protein n=1 Tax=Polychaeton citri CBS 116435 TaxID=1314669 RepID=A0A9P4Q4I5_9PEZI|nr:hypothetical protein K431DRAFT_314190 [Polychaeton citri CBS 116435]